MPSAPLDTLRCWILTDRSHYQTCHIRLPDGEAISAIALNTLYYGFRRRLTSSAQALKILFTLSDPRSPSRIADVALTINTKGSYFLWAREEYALPKGKFIPRASTSPLPVTLINPTEPLEFTKIRVPDLDQALSAVACNNRYYSIFKMEQNPDLVLDLAQKLSQRGDQVLVVSTPEGVAVCVLEPDATVAQ
jgi:hypothetical protein